jgi:RimJ/RimL family protein N-acetyltransferase
MGEHGAVDVFLETERLLLRRFTEADVDALFELDNDPAVMRYINGGEATSRAEIEKDILPAFLEFYDQFEGFGFWAAIEKSTGEFLGWFHFRPKEGAALDEPELGFRLRKSAWGKGFATEGSLALIRKGFTEFRVRRVVAETMVVNIASRRVMEKAGLEFEHVFDGEWPISIPGDDHGDIRYSLSREEWERRHATA